ncbi:MAG TPA: dihydroorotate dehydrogenase electron transfer subunit [Chloroflexota bacterium]|nr:dihydroorotate dehydrogenase electron transfer subunit [Chloroflexota bacterium]
MKQALATVIDNRMIARGMHLLRLEEPDQARTVQPGQFMHLRVGEATFDPLLRRPLSVLRTGVSPVNDLPAGQYDLLFDVVGRGTRLLAQLRPGDLVDVLGPLGRPFQISPGVRRLLLVGGGIGVVPLVALAEEAVRRRIAVTFLAGFRTAAKAYPAALLPREVEYIISTDDGSAGHRGYVTSLLPDFLQWADLVCACGPSPMLEALARLERPSGLPVQIAMEEHMGCAMGVCLGCVVPTRHGPRRVCRDGPVFDLEEMDWSWPASR